MWVDQAHHRGIELHAWFNPYRARHSSAKSALAPNHFAYTHATAVKQYGDMLWLDPAEPAALQRTLDVVADVVRRYDIDGVHLDDYFYPYPVQTTNQTDLDFPDEPAWQRYLLADGQATRADWRRQQVNALIEQMADVIHREKPWVRFGISPFGLGRTQRRAPGIVGFNQYDKLFADVELWLRMGWLDYLAPQLYWPIDQAPQAFNVLLNTWVRENVLQRHLWPGLFTSHIDDSAKSWAPEEITRQIALTRAQAGVTGHVHFSMAALLQDRQGIATRLKAGAYAQAALVPATPWLDAEVPPIPRLSLKGLDYASGSYLLLIEPGPASKVSQFAIWQRYRSAWKFSVQAAAHETVMLTADARLGIPCAVVVSAVNRLGVESARASVRLPSRFDTADCQLRECCK
jgi:uncharacterized lipoprotein YddW (UPF0748 family)